MLRLVLLLLYLLASSTSLHTKQGGSLDPLGLNTPPPAPPSDTGGGLDPWGLRNTSTPLPQTDGGGGWDPLG